MTKHSDDDDTVDYCITVISFYHHHHHRNNNNNNNNNKSFYDYQLKNIISAVPLTMTPSRHNVIMTWS